MDDKLIQNIMHIFVNSGEAKSSSVEAIRFAKENRFKDAFDYRRTVIDTSSCRFVFGEADFLPGLTIDKFEDYYVIKFQHLEWRNIKILLLKY